MARTRLFWTLVASVLGSDVITKMLAVERLGPRGTPHEVLGDAVRFTLVYNPGAAFGLHLGEHSRWIFIALTLGALGVLGRLLRDTREGDTARVTALGLVVGGAVGNLVDRIRSPLGVVDFIDVGIAQVRWPTFNIADMAVSTGAILLAWVLWLEDHPPSPAASGAMPLRAGETDSP